ADNPEKSVGNGMNENVLIENCTYGFCHSCLTMGSESVHNRNIVMRNIHVTDAFNLLWLKMRPDTPQLYEYITVERCEGDVHNFIYLRPWTQFYDLKDRPDVPMSYADHIRMTDCKIQCNQFFNVTPQPDQYKLSNFIFRDLEITALKDASFNTSLVEHFEHSNVNIK
ncbi:MAG: exopolygalacturonase, partial [Bacteroidales bacterium]|nr:exopolygalacturonase [Bacteroidales bacterium]